VLEHQRIEQFDQLRGTRLIPLPLDFGGNDGRARAASPARAKTCRATDNARVLMRQEWPNKCCGGGMLPAFRIPRRSGCLIRGGHLESSPSRRSAELK
jgi:hypothetical protein